jgi:hypothetical protein
MHPKEAVLVERFLAFDRENVLSPHPAEGGRDLVVDALWIFLGKYIHYALDVAANEVVQPCDRGLTA